VRNRDIMPIDRIVMRLIFLFGRLQMGDDLVSEEVEIDPLGRAPPFRAAEKASVESSSSIKIVDRKC
jgi:hypothetical protein